MNQYDIEAMYRNKHACQNVRKGVRLLYRLMQSINSQSDGWAYWAAGRKSADKLIALLKTAGNVWYDTDRTITDAQLKAAISPIRRMVTTQTKKQAQYGNTFAFDVDAALREEA